MIKAAERSIEEVNTLLFDDEAQELSGKDHATDSELEKLAPRLLKQKDLSSELEELEPVPYYKRPLIQGAMVLTVAIPLGWGVISSFSTGEATNTQLQSTQAEDSETQLLKESLEQERKKNQDLVVENGLKTQQLKVIPVKPKPTQQPIRQTAVVRPQPKPTPTLRTIIVSQPKIYRPTTPTPKPNFQPVQRIPSPEKVKLEKKPIEQWIAASNVGSFGSISSSDTSTDIDTAEQSNSLTTATTAGVQAEPESDSSYVTGNTLSQTNASTTAYNNYPNAELQDSSTFNPNSDLESEISGGSGFVPSQSAASTTVYSNYPNNQSQHLSRFNPPVPNRIVQPDNSNYQNASYATTTPQSIADRSTNFQTLQSDDSNYQTVYQTVNYTDTTPQLIVGTRAEGKLETGVAWSGELTNAMRSLLIQLSKPLLAADGRKVIPKGAYLVARVDNATDSGLLEMSVVSVLVKQNGRTIEKPLSEEAIRTKAIQILGKGGNYLQAKTTRRNNTRNDVGMALLSGASKIAGLSNQANFQSTYSDGNFTSITNSRDPNYLAGFGQGAAAEILRQQRERAQQVQQSTASQPNVFVLGRGTTVQVYVNQTTTFE